MGNVCWKTSSAGSPVEFAPLALPESAEQTIYFLRRRARMKQRPFGKTGFVAGEVGLGTWQIGGSWGDVAEDTAMEILRAAVDAGTNFFDTADVYGAGRSETIIGKFLKECSEPIFVATKQG